MPFPAGVQHKQPAAIKQQQQQRQQNSQLQQQHISMGADSQEENECRLNLLNDNQRINEKRINQDEEDPFGQLILSSSQQNKFNSPFVNAEKREMFVKSRTAKINTSSKRRILGNSKIDNGSSSSSSGSGSGSSSSSCSSTSTRYGRSGSCCIRFCRSFLNIFLAFILFEILLSVIIYYAPMEEPEIEPRNAPDRPRPKYQGSLGMNEKLDEAELLFKDQFHGPESFAWRRSNNRTFFTGVEGGFILEINPFEQKWHIVAQLNSPKSDISDESDATHFIRDSSTVISFSNIQHNNDATATAAASNNNDDDTNTGKKVIRVKEYCTKDVELYGEEAKSEPKIVELSRCSRPLGLRLSPDESYLYAVDPFSGLYRIDLKYDANRDVDKAATRTSRLIDWNQFDIRFADDLAVKWGSSSAATEREDKIYISDCSRRWTLRYLIRLLIEYDDTGRILEYNTKTKELRPLTSGSSNGGLTPVKIMNNGINSNDNSESSGDKMKETTTEMDDLRNLSFPNGLELTANSSALLVSDLGNRRILMHHLEGPLRGQTRHLLWVPGYSDNVKRGLDTPAGEPTYWLACGCAISDGSFELTEIFDQSYWPRKVGLKLTHYLGSAIEWFGEKIIKSSSIQNAGLEIKAIWLKKDPFCLRGLVLQFDEMGNVLRTLHAPHFSSNFKLTSEAHEIPDTEQPSSSNLFIGSVYYSYLGHLKLKLNS